MGVLGLDIRECHLGQQVPRWYNMIQLQKDSHGFNCRKKTSVDPTEMNANLIKKGQKGPSVSLVLPHSPGRSSICHHNMEITGDVLEVSISQRTLQVEEKELSKLAGRVALDINSSK